MKPSVFVLGIVVALVSVLGGAVDSYAQTNSVGNDCASVESVFARGSGQVVNESPEAKSYKELFESYSLAAGISHNHYELGTARQVGSDGIGYRYPAAQINGGWGGYQNAGGAVISGGLRHDYGKSVEDGVKELAIYLNERFTRGGACAESRIILAGYSQGAQVIGQFLAWNSGWVDQSVLDRIDYVALFGDPKTYLPEGAPRWGGLQKPSACLSAADKDYFRSQYRAYAPDCRTIKGALGERAPYALASFENRIGLWCNGRDPICDHRFSILFDGGYHGEYSGNGFIEDGVTRSLKRVAQNLRPDAKAKLLYSARNDGQELPADGEYYTPYVAPDYITTEVPASDCNAYIAIDREQPYLVSMRVATGTIPEKDLRYQAVELAKKFYSEGCALEFYYLDKELGAADYTLIQPSTRALDVINQTLRDLDIDGVKRDNYQAQCSNGFFDRARYSFVNEIASDPSNIDTSNRFGVTGGHMLCGRDNDAVQQLQTLYQQRAATGNQLSHESISPDTLGVLMYSPEFVDPDSGGADDTDEIPEALSNRDYALQFDLNRYYILAANETTLSVSYKNPVASDDEYNLFLWDFDGNGEIDDVTDTPTVTHTYPSSGDYMLEVYAMTVGDTTEHAYVEVMVRDTDAELMADDVARPAQPSEPKLEDIGNSTLAVTWQPTDNLAAYWLIQIGDTPGILVDIGDGTRVEITDMDTSQPIDIRIIGVTADGYRGEAASASYMPPAEQAPADDGDASPVDEPTPGRGGIDNDDTTQDLFAQPTAPSATFASLSIATNTADDFISFLANDQSSPARTLGVISDNQPSEQDSEDQTSTETVAILDTPDNATNLWPYVGIGMIVVAISAGGLVLARSRYDS